MDLAYTLSLTHGLQFVLFDWCGEKLYRHEFYQKPEEVVVTIFAKGLPASSVAVDFGEQIVCASLNCLLQFLLEDWTAF